MGAKRWDLLDERLDAVARTAWPVVAVRGALALLAATLSSMSFGPAWGAAWFAAFALVETTTRIVSGTAVQESMSRRRRLGYVACLVAGSLIWCALALRFWFSGEDGLQLAGFVVLTALMIHAHAFSFRAPAALAAVALPPAALCVLLPVAFGGYQGYERLTAAMGCVTLMAYLGASGRANARAAAALAEAERRASEANAAKSAFLGIVTHELRTPMNGVIGMARALQRTSLDARQRACLDTIVRSSDSLLRLLNDVLDHSKIEAGRMDLEVASFDLAATAEDSIQLWSETAAAKGLTLACEVDPALPARLMGDEMRVRQIILNLLSNALKFTETGSVTLALRVARAADGEDGVEISVADTGPGMTAEQLEQLFQPYVQAEASIARRYGGTGLGLFICRTLANMMGGQVSAESRCGHGSVFRVRLPLPAAENEAAAAPADEELLELPPLRVLAADDNPVNLAVLRALLEAAGLRLETAAHGGEALERLCAEPFDLVLMDVQMPVMDGVEALRRIRAGEAGPADTPVIALTAEAGPEAARRLAGAGFDALQTKPIRPAELLGVIDQVLVRKADRELESPAA